MNGMRRRSFLGLGAAAAGGAAAEAVLRAGGSLASAAPPAPGPAEPLLAAVSFEGAHQPGVVTPQPPHATFVALDVITDSRAQTAEALRTVSVRARELMAGGRVLVGAAGEGPTPDSGILGARVPPDGLTVTIGFGASLFHRVGLDRSRPRALRPMPVFPDDQIDAARTHGDVLVQLCAGTPETVIHALRDILRATRGALAPRWKVDGFLPAPGREPGAGRNMLGFKDGTANPDVRDGRLMNRLVWVGPDQGEPAWAVGGSYQVVRIIRNRVEFWDRVARREQELMIGRDKVSGRRLPDVPRDAHIRLANPRTPQTDGQRILRRGYSYSAGLDLAGQLDMGLLFCCYQRDVAQQFERVQARLAGEPLVDYVVPVGGGYFFLPPGARGAQDWVGSGLFA